MTHDYQGFLDELTELTKKYSIEVCGAYWDITRNDIEPLRLQPFRHLQLTQSRYDFDEEGNFTWE